MASESRRPSPLYKAVKHGDAIRVRRLLESGADPNDISGGHPLLLDAAYRGDSGILRLLLDRGAQVDAGLERGRTALVSAAAANHVEAVRTLLAAGASVNVAPDGYPLVNWLEWAGHKTARQPAVVTLLQDAGATVRPYKWLVWTWEARYKWHRILRSLGIRRRLGPPPCPPPIELPPGKQE